MFTALIAAVAALIVAITPTIVRRLSGKSAPQVHCRRIRPGAAPICACPPSTCALRREECSDRA